MKKTYLYLKTHKITGLKYLGKTVQNPHLYLGSGTYWRRHLEKHGKDISTEILLETYDIAEIKKWGTYYSKLWNVAESIEFANLKDETGDGGDTSMTLAYKEGIKKRNMSGRNNSMYGRSAVIENNLRWYNNGRENIYVPKDTAPVGYFPGRIISNRSPLTEETKIKISKSLGRACISPKGEWFRSRGEAAKVYGVSPTAIGGLIARGVSGWKWADTYSA